MTQEANVRVKIDTSQAKDDLRGLVRDAENTASKAGVQLRGAVRHGLSAFGLGAGIGAAVTAAGAATRSGVGDIGRDAFDLIGSQINDWVLGSLDDRTRAMMRAKGELPGVFGPAAAQLGTTPPGAAQWFDSTVKLYELEEKGRSILRSDPQFSASADMWKRFEEFLGKEIEKGFNLLADALRQAIWGR